MQFQCSQEMFETLEMQVLEIDGIFLTVYYHPGRGLVFIQTFDVESGVLIQPATPAQTALALRYFCQDDLQAYRELVAAVRRDPPSPPRAPPHDPHPPAMEVANAPVPS